MNTEFIEAITALEKEKGISKEVLIEAIESALVASYKRNYGTSQNVRVEIDEESGDVEVLMGLEVVEEVEDEMTEISLEEARDIDYRYELGDMVEYEVTPREFGRIAAQTAKQVIVQKIREAERELVYEDYIDRQGEMVTGTIQRISNKTIFVNLGRAEGLLPAQEQVPGEKYGDNDRIKVYIMDVKRTPKGPQIFLSRSHPAIVKKLFELEVPEIQDGIVEIKGIAREAGSRTKMAVWSNDDSVDPVGACVGTRGSRVQMVVDELFGEKIDIINWSDDPATLIKNVLSPAKAERVFVDEDERAALVIVPDYQLSLAIGREGQNVRLAAKVCGWKIDIKSQTQYEQYMEEIEAEEAAEAAAAAAAAEEAEAAAEAEGLEEEIEEAIEEAEVFEEETEAEAAEESAEEVEEPVEEAEEEPAEEAEEAEPADEPAEEVEETAEEETEAAPAEEE